MGLKIMFSIFFLLLVMMRMFLFHHFWKLSTVTFLEGVASFFAVNFIGTFFAIHLPLNFMTGFLSVLGGAPAVIFLLLTQILFHA